MRGEPGTGGARPSEWRAVVILSLSMGVLFAGHTMLTLAVPLVGLRYGLTPAAVGAVVSLPSLAPLLFAIPLGDLVGRLGPRQVLIGGFTLYSAGVTLSLLAPNTLGLLATQTVVGLIHVLLVLAAQSAVARLAPGEQMERAFGIYTSCISLGQLVGPLSGGLLLDHFDVSAPFVAVAVLPLVAIAISTRLPVIEADARIPGQGLGYGRQWELLKSNAGVQMSLVVTASVIFALGAHGSILPLFLEKHGLAAGLIGLLVSVRALVSTVIRPLTPWVVRSLGGRARTMLVSVVVVAGATALVGLTTEVLPLALLAALVGLGSGISQPLSMVAVADYVPLQARSSALAVRLMGNRGAMVSSPLLLGLLAEAFGFSVSFLFAGGLMALSAIWVARLSPRFERLKQAEASVAAGVEAR